MYNYFPKFFNQVTSTVMSWGSCSTREAASACVNGANSGAPGAPANYGGQDTGVAAGIYGCMQGVREQCYGNDNGHDDSRSQGGGSHPGQ